MRQHPGVVTEAAGILGVVRDEGVNLPAGIGVDLGYARSEWDELDRDRRVPLDMES